MREQFPSYGRRVRLAEQAFRARWDAAEVTVTKADGNDFFID